MNDNEAWFASPVDQVLSDEEGRTYHLLDVLAQGGQGAVCRTSAGDTLVKVLLNSAVDPLATARHVRRLPLRGLSVTPPMSLIAEPPGYVLQFQDEMVPARELRWNQQTHQKDFWVDTGGLARRLAICAHIAAIFEQLHARGLVYGDLNDRNVLVSEDAAYDAVTLIDLDNLRYLGDPCPQVFVTPGFAAPELWSQGAVPDFATDAFALAVLIFQIVTLVHPFKDGEAAKGSPVDGAAYEAAQRCALPSVLDDGRRNPCSSYPIGGVDRLLPLPLLNLLRTTFSQGRADPSARAASGDLRMAAYAGYCETIACEKCDWSYALSLDHSCPECGASSATTVVSLHVPGFDQPLWSAAVGPRAKRVDLALALPGLAARRRTQEDWQLELRFVSGRVRVRARQPEQLPLPPILSGGEPCPLPGFGDLELRVETQR